MKVFFIKRAVSILSVVLFVFFALTSCGESAPVSSVNLQSKIVSEKFSAEVSDKSKSSTTIQTGNTLIGNLTVSFIDVGQGDSELIEFPDNTVMLIDAGKSSAGDTVCNYLKSRSIKKIDYLVVSHPHDDHIGGMESVIDAFDIGKIYMNDVTSNTDTYSDLLGAIKDKGLKIKLAEAGVTIKAEKNLSCNILSPIGEYDDINSSSVVIKLTYGDRSFLFCGDAEADAEKRMNTSTLRSDVVKVAHHGSTTSSTAKFISSVSPEFAVISVGSENTYGLPKDKIINRWKKLEQKYSEQIFREPLFLQLTVKRLIIL